VYIRYMTSQTLKPKAFLYVRVSTSRQVSEGVSLEAQEAFLIAEAQKRGLDYEVVREEGKSGKYISARQELKRALERLDKKEASFLMANRLDRISRSVADFAYLLTRAQKGKWSLVVLDVDVDTSTPSGEFLVNVMASASQFERRIIGQRTKEALAEVRKQGTTLGRPPLMEKETLHLIAHLRKQGKTLQDIAQRLNEKGIKTAHKGSKWHASTIAKALQSQTLKAS
jgi:DNA invertase Pin-like site-specific DNA recombinase